MQVASYFIYQDSTTGIVDSLYVDYYHHGLTKDDEYNEFYEEVKVGFSDGRLTPLFHFQLKCGGRRYAMNKIEVGTWYNDPGNGFMGQTYRGVTYAAPPASSDIVVFEEKLDSLGTRPG